MSEDLRQFIEVCLRNTEELTETFGKNGDIHMKMFCSFTNRYIKDVAKQFGYEENTPG